MMWQWGLPFLSRLYQKQNTSHSFDTTKLVIQNKCSEQMYKFSKEEYPNSHNQKIKFVLMIGPVVLERVERLSYASAVSFGSPLSLFIISVQSIRPTHSVRRLQCTPCCQGSVAISLSICHISPFYSGGLTRWIVVSHHSAVPNLQHLKSFPFFMHFDYNSGDTEII